METNPNVGNQSTCLRPDITACHCTPECQCSFGVWEMFNFRDQHETYDLNRRLGVATIVGHLRFISCCTCKTKQSMSSRYKCRSLGTGDDGCWNLVPIQTIPKSGPMTSGPHRLQAEVRERPPLGLQQKGGNTCCCSWGFRFYGIFCNPSFFWDAGEKLMSRFSVCFDHLDLIFVDAWARSY